MTGTPSVLHRFSGALVLSACIVGGACAHPQSDVPPPVNEPMGQVIAAPPGAGEHAPAIAGFPVPATVADAPEPHIDLLMVDAPVRLVLQRLAELGKLDLVIPTTINRTISVQYVHVPVSLALRDVLSRSGLRLGTTNLAALPFDTVTVFYRLPANVDSMSADAIRRRFGVSATMADVIVKSRPPR